jgi:stress response protein SCP2
VFTVNSFRGQKFTDVRNAYCRLLDLESGAELVRYDLTESERSTGVIMSVLVRSGPAWDMTAIGEFHDGKSARAMYEPAERLVRSLAPR